ncbi:MAG: PorT family protein [Cyclobacteriaceae bacterium]|nr:outer membrane beta-barrel protein [Cyclobacteriaceae bacterium]MCH8517632.1 PorT family protein [Cyclobacteriaceae bacterium]
MIRIYIPLFILLISLTGFNKLYAQDFPFELGLTGDLALSFVNDQSVDPQSITDFSFGWEAGILARYELGYFWKIGMGINYSSQSFALSDYYFTYPMDLPPGFPQDMTEVDPVDTRHFYEFIDLPVFANIYFSAEGIKRGYFTFGAVYRHLIARDYSVSFISDETPEAFQDNVRGRSSGSTLDDEGFRRSNVALRAGLGIEQQLSRRAFYNIEANMQYNLFPSLTSNADYPIDAQFYSIGLTISLFYGL